jgi:cell wall-associated NlpC family hydrolase
MRPPDRHPGGGGLVWLLVAGALLLAPHLGPTSAPAQPAPHHGTRAAVTASTPGSDIAARAVAYAVAQVGKPYAWGAEGPGAFDCSGLSWAAWRHAGLAWPRMTAADQWHALRAHPVNRSGLRPGDLVFYADNPADWRSIHHVGLYAGAGRMVEAPYSGALVRYAQVDRAGWFGAARPSGGGRW